MLHFAPFLFRHSPAVPELDFSGTIVATGPKDAASETDSLLNEAESRGLCKGAEVFGSILIPEHVGGGHGTLAEYAIVDLSCAVKKPSNVSFAEASGLGVAGATALVLVERAKPRRGDHVLINGASGGIGTMVVQLVKDIVGDAGKVVAVCSGRNVDAIRRLGADVVSSPSNSEDRY